MKCIAMMGQSPPYEMFQVVDGTQPAPVPRAKVKHWNGNAWVNESFGVGATTMANYVSDQLLAASQDEEVRVYNLSSGGSALIQWNASPAQSTNYWVGAADGACLTNALATVVAGVTKPDVIVWWQGWQEYLSSSGDIKNDILYWYPQLRTRLLAAWNSGNPIPIIVCPPGLALNYPAPAPAQSPYVIAAYCEYAVGMGQSPNKVFLGFSNYDMPTRDGVHYTGTGYLVAGLRLGVNVCTALGLASYANVVMPRFVSAVRSNATFMLISNTSLLFPANSWATLNQIGLCSGVQAFVAPTFAPIPIVGVRPVGQYVRVDFQYPAGAHVVYQRDCTIQPTMPIYTSITGISFAMTPAANEWQFVN
jgi:hypothetical protein